jgi:signal transduction histidine kinase
MIETRPPVATVLLEMPAPQLNAQGTQARILIVDDDSVSLELLRNQLMLGEYSVRCARGGAAGLAAAFLDTPDLVVSDVIMPDVDGFELVRQLKGNDATRAVPVVLVTSLNARAERLRGLAAGADDFLTRPVDTSELEARVRSLLRSKCRYDRLQILNVKLEQALRARDEFLSVASHELRTPVAGVKAAAQLLLRLQNRGTLNTENFKQSVQELERSASRLAQLTEDLLNVTRLQDGRLPLRPTDVDLNELVGRTVARYRAQLPPTHALDLRLADTVCVLMADPGRIEQVVTNLLENAVKYSPAGGTVRVTVQNQAGGCLLEIGDRGIGLPLGASELIFEPFGRARNSTARHMPGLGLGLYICRQIAEAHAGRIWADSPGENEGTTVSLWLPLTSNF